MEKVAQQVLNSSGNDLAYILVGLAFAYMFIDKALPVLKYLDRKKTGNDRRGVGDEPCLPVRAELDSINGILSKMCENLKKQTEAMQDIVTIEKQISEMHGMFKKKAMLDEFNKEQKAEDRIKQLESLLQTEKKKQANGG